MVTDFSSEVPSGFLALQNLVKSSKEGPLGKLGSDLSKLYTGVDPLKSQVDSSSLKPESSLQVIGSSVAIEAVADTDSAQLLSDLKALGLQESDVFGRVISGVIPIDALNRVATLPSLRFARPSYKPILSNLDDIGTTTSKPIANPGSVASQGDQAQPSDIANPSDDIGTATSEAIADPGSVTSQGDQVQPSDITNPLDDIGTKTSEPIANPGSVTGQGDRVQPSDIANPLDDIGTTTSAAITNVGLVTSQGDQAQRSDIARATYGVNGAGITVGVLSDSYNNLGGAASDVASGDLPSGVIVSRDLLSGGSDEGRAMLQIVHDVAPGAKLAFHTAWLGMPSFANGILKLAKPLDSGGAGAKVIVDDVIYLTEPFFQDGIVTQAVDQVTSAGVAYFSSAGNQARQSYESAFIPGQNTGSYTLHDFDPSGAVSIFQKITLNNGAFLPVLQWDQPFASASTTWAGSENDLDMYLYADSNNDGTPDQLIASSINNNVGGDPFEFLGVQGTGTVYLAIGKWNPEGGPNPTKIKYVDFGDNTTYQFATNSSTSFGHNQSANGQGVAAAYYQDTPAFGTNPPVAEPFTSLGGKQILFDKAGNRLPTPVIRNQPAITAPDGVDTTFFGQDGDGNGKPNFFGTSAAAPSAAGAAALIRQTVPSATNTQTYNALKNTAVDMNTSGYDYLTGGGLVRADAAIASLCINGTAGNDNLTGTADADVMYGFAGKDTLSGLAGNDVLNGGAGNDILNGGVGADQLKGGNGNDSLSGGAGDDTLSGGAGADKFIYNTNAAFTTSAVGMDTITDFTIGQGDKIVLDKTTFTSISSIPGTGFSVASEFAKVTTDALAATSAADIVYNTATGGLFYNQNGTASGFGTGGQFLTLTNKPALTAYQFLIQA